MRVGITGASGFIGAALVRRHLEAGHDVRCLTRRPGRLPHGVQPIEGDLERPDDRLVLFTHGLDVLYHCAGELLDERRMTAVNVGGVGALLRAAEGRIGRWVQLSSAGVYGRHRNGVISEETVPNPQGLYERTKAEADALVMAGVLRGAIGSCTMLRPSIVFGREMPNASIRQMIRVIRCGLFFFIGARGASANYIHVDNVVDALVACGASAHASGRIYNLSDWCTVEDFVAAIADALGRPRPRLRLPEPPVRCAARLTGKIARTPLTESRVDALVTRSRYSIARIQQELHYVPRVRIPDGLADMIAGGRAA
jgi:nucleoside-diphosphate-sugar epimerase